MFKLTDKKALFLAYLGLLAAILFLSSCSQSKKLQKAKETMLDNPSELAKICSERFPAKETTIYIPGETVVDTVFTFQEVMIPVECPPSDKDTIIQWKIRNVRETVKETKVDTVNRVTVDKAREFYLESQIDQLTKEKKELQAKVDQLKKYRNWLIWLAIGVFLGLGIWFYSRIKAGAINSILNKLK